MMNTKKTFSWSDDISDEEYWGSSKSRGFNFDEDVADLRTAKSLTAGSVFDNDDTELINWDDSKVETSARSVRFVQRGSASSARTSTSAPQNVHNRDSAPPAGFSFPKRDTTGIESFIDGGPGQNKTPSLTELAKLESQNRILQSNAQAAKLERWSAVPPDETVRRILRGQPYNLELYRALQEKLALLDEAIKCHDGNAITAAVLFLKSTVKKSIFNREMMLRPQALNQYINFLTQTNSFNDLEDILGMMGRIEESAMLKYKQAISSTNAETKKRNLETCLRTHFQSSPGISLETRLLQEHVSLLERQLPVEDADSKDEREGKNQMFKEYPRAASLINMPVITTLYYCCFYHYDLSENSFASPLSIKNHHQLTDKQFLWIALSARSKLRRWKDVEKLLTTKGMFGTTKMKAVIGFDRVVDVLQKTGAPTDALSKYTRLIDDPDLRLEIAIKCRCHHVVIDTFVAMKDRAQIESYKAKVLEPHTEEFYYAQNALSNSSIKWKN
ncbi:spermatogenesis-defective protein 39 homolog isoform X2 [Tubulanus polymorphus]|uniref:spermatogenesis-defective protein 39 homolog isoform X2 n=1 Tax=Tubulanus polymorphus TaxID=672921 RepID=UPI003DA28586